jgi:energy-coupling factor transport system permease protein
MNPLTALAASVAAIVAAIVLPPLEAVSYAALASVSYCLITRNVRGLRRFIGWSLAFAVPLILMHGVLNAQYPITTRLLILPIREAGLDFGAAQAARILCLFVPALYWSAVNRMSVIEILKFIRLDRFLASAIFEGFSLAGEMEHRARIILEAQRARGIRTSGPPWTRIRALVAVVLPLAATLLRDAPTRVRVQEYLGSVEASFAGPRVLPSLHLAELGLLVLPLAALVTPRLLEVAVRL